MKEKLLLILILFFCFVFRVLITPYGTFAPDLMTYMDWGKRVNDGGFSNFYNDWSDYLPGYIYVLWVLAKVRIAVPTITNELLYKLPSIFSDIATMYLIYLIVERLKNKRWGLVGAFVYGITPAVFGNSSLWGQTDSFSTLPMVLAVYFLLRNKIKINIFFAGIFLGMAAVLKPSGWFLGPLLVVYLMKMGNHEGRPYKNILFFLVPAVAVFLLAFVPFSGGNIYFAFVVERVQKSITQHSATCLNTYNFWMVTVGCWKEASQKFFMLSLRQWGLVLFTISYLSILIKTKRRMEDLPLAIAIIFFSGFLFLTGMHERHIFQMFPFLAIAACIRIRLWIPYFVMAIFAFVNLWYAQAWFAKDRAGIYGPFYTNLFSLVMIFVWVYLMIDFVKGSKDEKA